MNCKLHSTVAAVATCAVCGVGMCSECTSEAFYITESGQPLCKECSLEEAAENVVWGESYLKKMKWKLIFSSIALVVSIGCFVNAAVISGDSTGALGGVICLVLCGLIQTWGHEKDKGSIKSIIFDGQEEGEFSLSKFFYYIIAGPIKLVINLKKYPKLKVEYQKDVQKYEEIKSSLDSN